MIRKKIDIELNDFPNELHGYLAAGDVYDSSCSPEARALYCSGGYYIKIAPRGELAREAELDRVFHSLGMGVEVVCYLSKDRDYLVTAGAVGADLTHAQDDPEGLCAVMARALRKLHTMDPAGAPRSAKLREYEAVTGDGYDEYLLVEGIGVDSREDARRILREGRYTLKADTLIHGDACLPNIICRDGQFSSFIDCGLGGLGDRHIDLFWAMWSIQFNLKTSVYSDLFLDLYGREDVNMDVLRTVAALELLGTPVA